MYKIDDVDYYLKMLLKSMKAVKMKLVSYEKDGKDEYLNERAFAYELYRQLSNRIYDDVEDNDKWKEDRPKIVLNAELYKCVGKEDNKDDKGRTFPDIVIHGGQHNTDKQFIVCEIKVKASESAILEDLKKLFDYMDYDKMFAHPYSLAIFINVGPRATFESNLKKSISKLNKCKGHLVCISYDCGNVAIVNHYF